MFKLLKNGHVYSPEDLGVKDILLWEDRVIKIGEGLKIPEGFEIKEIGFFDEEPENLTYPDTHKLLLKKVKEIKGL